jgi:hypothetical protein
VIWDLMKQLSIAQSSGNPTYWKTSYENEEHMADHKMLAIFINNYFAEKVGVPVVLFSVYGFLWSFVIQYHVFCGILGHSKGILEYFWVNLWARKIVDTGAKELLLIHMYIL